MKKGDRIIIRIKGSQHGLRGTITRVSHRFINVLWDDNLEEHYSATEVKLLIKNGQLELVIKND